MNGSAAGRPSEPGRPAVDLYSVVPRYRPLPPDDAEAALVELYDSHPFGPTHSIRDGVRVQSNMVMSFDGAVIGATGVSGSVSTHADMRVFSVIRSLADVVIVGAGTVRAEQLTRLSAKPLHQAARAGRSQPPVPTLAIVTGSGDLDWDRLNSRGDSPVIVYTSATDPAVVARLRENATVVQGDPTPAAVALDLIRRGHRRLLCEGGPTLLGQWVAAGWIDEMCLTIAPTLQGNPGSPPLLGSAGLEVPVPVRVTSLVTDGHSMMYRLAVQR